MKGDFDLERRGQKSQEVTSFDKNEKMKRRHILNKREIQIKKK